MEQAAAVPAEFKDSQAGLISQMINESAKQANEVMKIKMHASSETRKALLRQQLDTAVFQFERSLSNEMSNRKLSSMFGSFSLVQKIMQNMG